jgi:hypothetical protein
MNLDFMDEDGYFGADHVEAQKVKIPHPRSTIPLLNRILGQLLKMNAVLLSEVLCKQSIWIKIESSPSFNTDQ